MWRAFFIGVFLSVASMVIAFLWFLLMAKTFPNRETKGADKELMIVYGVISSLFLMMCFVIFVSVGELFVAIVGLFALPVIFYGVEYAGKTKEKSDAEKKQNEEIEEKKRIDALTPAQRKKEIAKKQRQALEEERLEFEKRRIESEELTERVHGEVVKMLVCPHCQSTGCVRRKDGLSEEKYLNANNLYRSRKVTKMKCDKCDTRWEVV